MGDFRRLAAQGEKLLLSVVWDVEIRRHFSTSIDSQVQVKLPNFAKIGSNKEAVKELNTRAAALSLDAQRLVEKEWDSVKTSFNTELIAIPHAPTLANDIFHMWSSSSWPFEKRKEKRDEFQDAFALTSLLAHADSLRSKPENIEASILVITADQGCREFCAQTASLIPCSNINSAIEFLSQRNEILRLAERSREISIQLEDAQHPMFSRLHESLAQIQAQFPPPCFSFTRDNRDTLGWLRNLSIDSITLLKAGPRGTNVEVLEERDNVLHIKGRVRFELTLSLNSPGYIERTAIPSAEVVVSNGKFTFDTDFAAGNQGDHWFGGVTNISQPLRIAML